MVILTTILFFTIIIGLTNIIAREHVFNWLRAFFDRTLIGDLLSCMTCLGFWVSFIIYPFISDMLPLMHSNIYISSFLIACISSFLCKVVDIKVFTL